MDRREFSRRLMGAIGATALPSARDWRVGAAAVTGAAPPRVDGARLDAQLLQLSEFGKNPQGGVSRVAYSDADVAGRRWLLGVMRDAGLSPRTDTAGNILARVAGREATAKPIVIGSHIDSVPEGGNYDGDVGTLAAIEVARTLRVGGVTLRHPLDVVCWQNEEGGLFGSRAVSGELTDAELSQTTSSGKTVRDGIAFIGGDVARLGEARWAKGSIAAYVELHIEQGGTLDERHLDIGVVEGIVGIWRWDVAVQGFANHAGTTAMDHRQDALLAAARFIEMVNRVARSESGRQVATVGKLQVEPNAPNVIPGHVALTLEMRDLDGAKIARLQARMEREAQAIGTQNGTTFRLTPSTEHQPAMSDPGVRATIDRCARSLGLSTLHLPSGAGHDAQSMARLGPMGMIFIPSVGGISHAPKEFSRSRDITNGANVLLQTVLALDEAGASRAG